MANQLNNRISQQSRQSPVQASDAPDSDSGFEVLEEPTLRPSELVRGNHNRTMSSISGELFSFVFVSIDFIAIIFITDGNISLKESF